MQDYAEVMSDNGSLSDKNLFVYCDNNPVMRKDEDGEFWNILIGAAVGFVVGAGVSIVTQAMAGELDFTSRKTWAHIGISALSGTIQVDLLHPAFLLGVRLSRTVYVEC